ncbi:hypothetical protein N7494_011792 [Penicillium frequentans]|uniref:TauD/TfdA-like domain-containing protein n=1 Tax=Penicillium frequentans TaxID=3151616 RepID=A0AAD6GAH5_9EURO|nr:hypothetical protein N7494_011792 [Penicillium glabrum]
MTVTLQPQQPDIDNEPIRQKWLDRTARRLRNADLSTELPTGFPKRLISGLVWDGQSLPAIYDWTYHLSSEDLEEIKQAVAYFRGLNKPLGHIGPDTFPLPNLHDKLRDVSNEVHNGHGFKIVRGVPVDEYSREENIIIYAGISSHVASERGRQLIIRPSQKVLTHVKDLVGPSETKKVRIATWSSDRLNFHTDVGDIISLFCLETAAEGGSSQLASSWKIYNELAATRPDLIKTLAEDWPHDTHGATPGGCKMFPILHYQPATGSAPERVIVHVIRREFTGTPDAPRSKNIPPITEAQAEALDALHFLGEKHQVRLDFKKGDIQYVNNFSIIHSRESFKDTPEQQRHLLRLWLRDPENAWEIPGPFKERLGIIYNNVEKDTQEFPLEAEGDNKLRS